MSINGMIFNLKKFAIHDGPGIRTSIFLKGCPLKCWWCHNPEGQMSRPEVFSVNNSSRKKETYGRNVTVNELINEIEKDRVFYEQSGGGVTFTGGEPMMQIDFLEIVLHECKKANINTAVDTCGYAPFGDFERILEDVDLFLYDLKIIDDKEHQKYTGASNKIILENLQKLSESGSQIIIRIALIPGITDGQENLDAIYETIKPLDNIKNISLLPYNILGEDKRERFNIRNNLGHLTATETEALVVLRKQFESYGYAVKVGG